MSMDFLDYKLTILRNQPSIFKCYLDNIYFKGLNIH